MSAAPQIVYWALLAGAVALLCTAAVGLTFTYRRVRDVERRAEAVEQRADRLG